VLERHGIDADAAAAIGDHIAAGEFTEAFDLVTEGMIDAFSVAGTPETVVDRMAALREHTEGIVIGSPLGPDPEAAVELAADAWEESAPE
jgi:5,10-methylenetetrahydromethanopterin reductase